VEEGATFNPNGHAFYVQVPSNEDLVLVGHLTPAQAKSLVSDLNASNRTREQAHRLGSFLGASALAASLYAGPEESAVGFEVLSTSEFTIDEAITSRFIRAPALLDANLSAEARWLYSLESARAGLTLSGPGAASPADPGFGTTGAQSVKRFEPPPIGTNSRGQLTNGPYTLDAPGMAPHKTGATRGAKSQFLYQVDAEKATLDAAAYADEEGLWVGNKAKVFVENGPVGVLGNTGEPTSWINVYRTKTGFVHGAPGSAP
jgi:hypothetical protein